MVRWFRRTTFFKRRVTSSGLLRTQTLFFHNWTLEETPGVTYNYGTYSTRANNQVGHGPWEGFKN